MYLLSELRDYLIASNIVRKPSVAGAKPPLWIDPRDGVPAPGEGQATEVDNAVVLGAFVTGGIPMSAYESFLRRDIVDVWIRCASATTAFDMEVSLRTALVDKRNWSMANMNILESLEWRSLQRLESGPQGFTFQTSYLFWRRAS